MFALLGIVFQQKIIGHIFAIFNKIRKIFRKIIGVRSISINSEKEISAINLAIELYMSNKFDEKLFFIQSIHS